MFKYARAVKQKVWNEAEKRERDWVGEHSALIQPTFWYMRVEIKYVLFIQVLCICPFI